MASPLISALDLAALKDKVRLLDCRPAAAYETGHLPGALHADLERDLSRATEADFDPDKGGRHPLPDLRTWRDTLGRWGITPDTAVVCYDDQGGANAAARAWWMLRATGHERVRVLDGGLAAVMGAGMALTMDAPSVETAPPYPASHWQWTTVDIGVVEKLARHAGWTVLDVRSAPRYRGETEPIDPVPGHIPGAKNRPFSENLEADGRFKSFEALRELYSDLDPARLVVHCGSGVTACHTLLALDAAGLPGGALFVGSWGEWCRSDRAIATGANP
ncbi:MAG TPA: sulfurtransferase [Holophagaceae bacterium]|jgi:thiosulfate/3-mercaptopyruvate sulfurtransferase|nr:sulfurtransferase [Holophagaceae bacterium]